MRASKHLIVIVTAVLIASLLGVTRSSAYTYMEFLGAPVPLDPPYETFEVYNCSVHYNGQDGKDFRRVNRQWNWVYGMWDYVRFTKYNCGNNPGIAFANGRSEVVYTHGGFPDDRDAHGRALMDSATISVLGWNTAGSNIRRLSTDVIFNADSNFQYGKPGCFELPTGPSFRQTALHEVGHALGLEHAAPSQMATMVPYQNSAKYCAYNMRYFPHPDDAQGGRFLYDSGNTSYEVAVSAWERINHCANDPNCSNWESTSTFRGSYTVRKCPGDTLEVWFSRAGRGNASNGNDASAQIMWSANSTIEPGDTTVKTLGTFHFDPERFHTTSRWNVTIPESSNHGAVYYLGVRLKNLAVSEGWFHSNNDTPLRPKVEIRPASDCN